MVCHVCGVPPIQNPLSICAMLFVGNKAHQEFRIPPHLVYHHCEAVTGTLEYIYRNQENRMLFPEFSLLYPETTAKVKTGNIKLENCNSYLRRFLSLLNYSMLMGRDPISYLSYITHKAENRDR